MGRLVVLALAFLGLLLLQADAQAPRRVALVVGNGTYEEAGTLANPVNDAVDIAAKLRGLGFEVIEGKDLGKRALEQKIGEFSDALQGAAVGLFYYAGHGLQVDGRNYIVPVDAHLDVPVKLQLEAVPIDEVLDIMEQQTETSLVFLDACRNNPFARSLALKSANRSAAPLQQGLAQFDSTRGSFIAFSTAPGSVAMDGSGRNSPFAAALLRHVAEPGKSINDLMIEVRRDVVSETRQQQRPWEQGSLLARFEFVPGGTPVTEAAPPAPPPAETQVVTAARSVGDQNSVEDFLKREYLAPEAAAIGQSVERIYAPSATIFGVAYDLQAIVKAKTDWFSQWSSWTLSLEPGSLAVTPHGDSSADAVFAMAYDYAPKNGPPRVAGKARVTLGLVKMDGVWKIASETSQPLP